MTPTVGHVAIGTLIAANVGLLLFPKWRENHPNAEKAIELATVVAFLVVMARPSSPAPSAAAPLTVPQPVAPGHTTT